MGTGGIERAAASEAFVACLRQVRVPSHAPDMNLSGRRFKIRDDVRRADPHRHDAIVSTRDAAGWVRHGGYALPRQPP